MLTKLLAAVALLCALTAGVNSIEADKLFASGQPCTMNGDTPTCVPCTGVDTSAEVDLGDSYIVFNGESFNSLFVNTNGYVTFGTKHGGPVQPLNLYRVNIKKIIAAYWANTEPRCGGIAYRVLKRGEEEDTFLKAETEIMRANVPRDGTFKAEAIVVLTYKDAKPRNSLMMCSVEPDNTFQLVLVTNNTHSYALFLYEHLGYKETADLGDYAIAAIGTGGGVLNIVQEVHEVSGTVDVDTLPSITGNVLKEDFTGYETGYFIFLL